MKDLIKLKHAGYREISYVKAELARRDMLDIFTSALDVFYYDPHRDLILLKSPGVG